MLVPATPQNEHERLKELHALAVLDSAQEPLFDDIVKLSSHIMKCPISLISLVDFDRQWFKAKVGLEAAETPRDMSFCAHAIHEDSTLIVEDALRDERFADNPLVTNDPHIRFYAGHPLTTTNGFRIGTLCVIDHSAKRLSPEQLDMLSTLARQASSLLERRRDERALATIRRNSQSLFEKIPAVVVSMRGAEHVIDYISSTRLNLFGDCSSLGKPLLQAQPDARTSGLHQVLDDVYHQGVTLSVRDATFTVERSMRHFDFVCTPRMGLDGTIDGVMGIYEDITDRIRLEQTITQLSDERSAKYEQLAELVEALPLGIALMEGTEHRFVFANKQFRTDFVASQHFVGRHAAEVLLPSNLPQMLAELATVEQTGRTSVTREQKLCRHHADGSETHFYCDSIYQPLTEGGQAGRVILMAAQDVSEQVCAREEMASKVEDLHRERELRERFVAALTHDLRMPLTAARMNAQRLTRKNESPATVATLTDRIISSIDRGENMVQNLLDANRLKAGESLPIVTASRSPKQLFEGIVSELDVRARVVAKLDPALDTLQVCWDPDAIRRIIENLSSNAAKYGSADHPIEIAAKSQADKVIFSVYNQGNPISRGERSTLFDSYHRSISALGSGHKGWGIGLALVKGLVEAHRGTIRVESEEGLGTTFSVALPLDPRA